MDCRNTSSLIISINEIENFKIIPTPEFRCFLSKCPLVKRIAFYLREYHITTIATTISCSFEVFFFFFFPLEYSTMPYAGDRFPRDCDKRKAKLNQLCPIRKNVNSIETTWLPGERTLSRLSPFLFFTATTITTTSSGSNSNNSNHKSNNNSNTINITIMLISPTILPPVCQRQAWCCRCIRRLLSNFAHISKGSSRPRQMKVGYCFGGCGHGCVSDPASIQFQLAVRAAARRPLRPPGGCYWGYLPAVDFNPADNRSSKCFCETLQRNPSRFVRVKSVIGLGTKMLLEPRAFDFSPVFPSTSEPASEPVTSPEAPKCYSLKHIPYPGDHKRHFARSVIEIAILTCNPTIRVVSTWPLY